MEREDVKKIYLKVCDLFPNFRPKDQQGTFDEWVKNLSPYSKMEVEETLREYISNNPAGYAPNISQLIPKKDSGGFRGRTYTREDFEEMEQAGLKWLAG